MAEEQRDYAKQLAYGLLYGKGPHALAVDLSCDVKKAAKQQESFMRAIPNVVSVTPLLLFSVVSLLHFQCMPAICIRVECMPFAGTTLHLALYSSGTNTTVASLLGATVSV